jgi:hypothetical protein
MARWFGTEREFFPAAVFLVGIAVALPGCNRAASEPDGPTSKPTAEQNVEPLSWDAPPLWTKMPPPKRGAMKASYRVAKVGNDKGDAEVAVFFYGTGSLGDSDLVFKQWFGQFEGDAGPGVTRDRLEGSRFPVEIVELTGAYKVGLGPERGPGRRSPMEMVRQGYRLVGAVVRTPDRGNWFFKMTGPDETVRSASAAFRDLVKTAR